MYIVEWDTALRHSTARCGAVRSGRVGYATDERGCRLEDVGRRPRRVREWATVDDAGACCGGVCSAWRGWVGVWREQESGARVGSGSGSETGAGQEMRIEGPSRRRIIGRGCARPWRRRRGRRKVRGAHLRVLSCHGRICARHTRPIDRARECVYAHQAVRMDAWTGSETSAV